MTDPARLVRTVRELPDPRSLQALPLPDRVLLADPTYFDVETVQNPHMEGNVDGIDRYLARLQWRQVEDAYRSLGMPVDVLPPQPFLPDFVFCANQTLPVPAGLLSAGPTAIRSIMRSARREPEVPHVVAALEKLGVEVLGLDPYLVPRFEGTGDALWHPRRALLYGGRGPRSTEQAYEFVSAWTGVPAVLLNLIDPRFYHLDTCLAPIDEITAVCFPGAFDDEGLAMLRRCFPRLLEVGEADAMWMFCNGHSPDGKTYIVQEGSAAAADLRALGYELIEVETGEFRKAGGSVFCMKLAWWST